MALKIRVVNIVNEKIFSAFKFQKRHSTDAGVQTEPVAAAPAAEKAKWNQKQHWSFPVQTPFLLLNLLSLSLSHYPLKPLNYFNYIFCL